LIVAFLSVIIKKGKIRILKERGHPDVPLPTISDGWGGIDEAMIEV
jgi:hypothetical protein